MAKKEKGAGIERDRKVQKLTRMIKSKERELATIERKDDAAKEKVARTEMSKGDYQRLKTDLTRQKKAVRGAITRLERSRLNRERRLKERASEKEQRDKEREERRRERALERERRKEERTARSKGATDEKEE